MTLTYLFAIKKRVLGSLFTLFRGFVMQDNEELLKLLEQVDPTKPYGTKLFNALCRLTVNVAIEAVCIRETFDTLRAKTWTEVYLVQRSLDDTAYRGQWHCPGSVMRPGESVEDIMNRLSQKEFGTKLTSCKFVANFNYPQEERGHSFSLIYLCQLEVREKMQGKWFSLPWDIHSPTVVQHHRQHIIPIAVQEFFKKS